MSYNIYIKSKILTYPYEIEWLPTRFVWKIIIPTTIIIPLKIFQTIDLTTSFDESKLAKLIPYVTKDHHDLSQKKIAFKFPSISADLLSASNDSVLNFFAKEDDEKKLPNVDKIIDCLMCSENLK